MKAIFVVGIPGAGKSYTIKQLTGSISPKIVNTDKATEFLSKKFDMESNDNTWKSFFRDKTRPLTTSMLSNYLNSLLPLFIDGTSNDAANILGRAGLLESLGYDIGMVFVDTNLDVARDRAKKRGDEIGRHVNPEFIDKVYELSQENKEYFRGKFSFFKEVKNNPSELDDDAILKIYRQVSGFYNDPVENPVGKRILKKLSEAGGKYLVPDILEMDELQNKVKAWYR